ncbi:retinol dehydrogenase 7 [Callorhinchus milii]|uniref:Dehydrogenase/reductase (SDR family) member 9 n=1 Tax=Callorhinchus milii TaxID=7868 RepID=A0A4W3HQP1_CALMI|nr:retinol dehydrogenase 7 [Callorhinchus milii]|eukprot:gi/632945461/ref/XP_007888075.1/ PREDICTED: retinol dehydrogenase 7-like [Callorhinchus milii]
MLVYVVAVLLFLGVLYYRHRDSKRLNSVNDKHVYITGCDSGFGHRLAQRLDELGFYVLAACYTQNGAEDLKTSTSPRLKILQLDVTNSESINKAAEIVKSEVKEKGLWGLVNNAGISFPSAPSDWLTIEDYKEILAVNLIGVIEVTLSVLPLIKKARGRVVNIASIFGRLSIIGGAYCISKYGVEAFNDSLRRDMHDFGVKVLCVEPSFFKTRITRFDLVLQNTNKLWEKLSPEVKEDYGDDFVEKSMQVFMKTARTLIDPDLMKVVWCMEHALTAVHPRTRYSAGLNAKYFWIPLSYMPTVFADFVFRLAKVKPAKSVV